MRVPNDIQFGFVFTLWLCGQMITKKIRHVAQEEASIFPSFFRLGFICFKCIYYGIFELGVSVHAACPHIAHEKRHQACMRCERRGEQEGPRAFLSVENRNRHRRCFKTSTTARMFRFSGFISRNFAIPTGRSPSQ